MCSVVTEQPNPLSAELDRATPGELVQILSAVDQQLFSGWNYAGESGVGTTTDGLGGAAFQIHLHALSRVLAELLLRPAEAGPLMVVMSGCGTSGRLAHLCSELFNRVAAHHRLPASGQSHVFRYLCAGGDAALVASQEGAEDDAQLGEADLRRLVGEPGDPGAATRVVFFGISCGLSAPYVAGQLRYCSEHADRFVPVLVGFNPPEAARNTPIRHADFTFASVVQRLRAMGDGAAFLLTPVVGPEALSGSTRLKGGSATKIVLETAVATAVRLCAAARGEVPASPSALSDLLDAYAGAARSVYAPEAALGLAALVRCAGDCLRAGGRIVYLGERRAGLLGFIDASEQPPTFGASPDDVRGFVQGGWGPFHAADGDLSGRGERYLVAWGDFERLVLPRLSARDLVIGLPDLSAAAHGAAGRDGELDRLLGLCAGAAGAHTAVLLAGPAGSEPPSARARAETYVQAVVGAEEPLGPAFPVLAELATKLMLNAVSTGAHVSKGCVYRNRMVTLRLSNSKLVFRAFGIVEALAGCSRGDAEEAVLRAIYGVDVLSAEQRSLDTESVARHVVTAAAAAQSVVPAALLLTGTAAQGRSVTVSEAREQLTREPIVRAALERILNSKAASS